MGALTQRLRRKLRPRRGLARPLALGLLEDAMSRAEQPESPDGDVQIVAAPPAASAASPAQPPAAEPARPGGMLPLREMDDPCGRPPTTWAALIATRSPADLGWDADHPAPPEALDAVWAALASRSPRMAGDMP